jgi:mersacidin/lichenicidin family type 2 lantibiotic
MSNKNIIRAWKDEDYRLSLSEAERALLPEHPAGLIELSGAEMDGVGGGGPPPGSDYPTTGGHPGCPPPTDEGCHDTM